MRIATKYFIVCVLAATIATLSSRGADTDAQIKAREALRQKMSELDAQRPVTNPSASAPAVPTKAPESQPAPVAKPTPEPAPTTPTPTPTPDETVKTVPAPATTHTVIEAPPTRATPPGQLQAPAPVVKTTRPPKQPKQPKPKPVAETPKPAPASGQFTASRPDSEKVAKARQALQEKMRELDAEGGQPPVATHPIVTQPPVTTQPVVVSQPPPASTPKTYRTPEITSQPTVSANDANEPLPTPPPVARSSQPQNKPQSKPQVLKRPAQPTAPAPRQVYALPAGPPAPVSADKVLKLDTLLQQYRADRITPEQYQQERAKILAGP
jgi:hypothetical protein